MAEIYESIALLCLGVAIGWVSKFLMERYKYTSEMKTKKIELFEETIGNIWKSITNSISLYGLNGIIFSQSEALNRLSQKANLSESDESLKRDIESFRKEMMEIKKKTCNEIVRLSDDTFSQILNLFILEKDEELVADIFDTFSLKIMGKHEDCITLQGERENINRHAGTILEVRTPDIPYNFPCPLFFDAIQKMFEIISLVIG